MRGLHIDDLSVSFRVGNEVKEITHEVRLRVEPAQVVALVGESGSGKSVTAMSVLGLLPSNAQCTGRVLFDGEDLLLADEKRIAQVRGNDISMVFQEPMTALNPVYTIETHLIEAIRSHRSVGKADARREALTLLEQVGLPNPARLMKRYPHEISGGQRQRAMIAMAISAKPKLLIADEPTTALDVTVQAGILDLLLRLRDELGMALLIITHDMGVVADVADRVVVMQHGVVVDRGAVEEVFYESKVPYTRQLLEAVPDLEAPLHEGAVKVESTREQSTESVLRLENLAVSYRTGWRKPPFAAVDGVSLSIADGEMVGLVGESGSGKSTLGRAVLGLAPISSGSAHVAGIDVAEARPRQLRDIRRHVSVVFQDPGSSLNPRVTIGRTITDPLRWTGAERDERRLATMAGELLESVRIPKAWVDRYPHELSGGQRQRVSIARAISTRPRFMVADEPTSALDVSVQAAVLELLQELQAEIGFSCLFISHDLAVVEQIASRVVVLRHGRVVEQGEATKILRSPTQPYTQELIAAVPVPDPIRQRERRLQRLMAHSASQ